MRNEEEIPHKMISAEDLKGLSEEERKYVLKFFLIVICFQFIMKLNALVSKPNTGKSQVENVNNNSCSEVIEKRQEELKEVVRQSVARHAARKPREVRFILFCNRVSCTRNLKNCYLNVWCRPSAGSDM